LETITNTTCPAFTKPIYDSTGPLFTNGNGNPVHFSASSGISDPLTESLAHVLRTAEIHNPTWLFKHNEVPLYDLDKAQAEDEEESADQFTGVFISY
jgi:hypothetical protein